MPVSRNASESKTKLLSMKESKSYYDNDMNEVPYEMSKIVMKINGRHAPYLFIYHWNVSG